VSAPEPPSRSLAPESSPCEAFSSICVNSDSNCRATWRMVCSSLPLAPARSFANWLKSVVSIGAEALRIGPFIR